MKTQKLFTLLDMPKHLAVLTEMEDGKTWVRYYWNGYGMSDNGYEMAEDDHKFVKAVFLKINNFCKAKELTLFIY